jgi:hypothetical protein
MRKLLGLMALLSAVGVVAVAATGAFAAESTPSTTEAATPATVTPLIAGCEPNHVCVYNGTEWGGEPRIEMACSEGGLHGKWTVSNNSGANKCGNKTAWLRWNGNTVKCLDPGQTANNVGLNEVYISIEYGSFC